MLHQLTDVIIETAFPAMIWVAKIELSSQFFTLLLAISRVAYTESTFRCGLQCRSRFQEACRVKLYRRPSTDRKDAQNGDIERLISAHAERSAISVAHVSRSTASSPRTLLAENLAMPSLWVIITELWY
jgi:hypothetical protein